MFCYSVFSVSPFSSFSRQSKFQTQSNDFTITTLIHKRFRVKSIVPQRKKSQNRFIVCILSVGLSHSSTVNNKIKINSEFALHNCDSCWIQNLDLGIIGKLALSNRIQNNKSYSIQSLNFTDNVNLVGLLLNSEHLKTPNQWR